MLSEREASLVAALREEYAVVTAKVAALKAFLAAYDADFGGAGGGQGSAAASASLAPWQKRDAAIVGAARELIRSAAYGSTTSREIRKRLETQGIDLQVKAKSAAIVSCLNRYPEFRRLDDRRWAFQEPEKPEAVLAAADDKHVGEQRALSPDNTPPDMDADETTSFNESSNHELGDGIDDIGDGAQSSGAQAHAAQVRDPDQSSGTVDVKAELDAVMEPEQPATDRDR